MKCKENWFNHFNKFLGQLSESSINLPKVKISWKLNISTDLFNLKELRVITDKPRNKKSPGLVSILAILWKDELFHQYLLNLCNHVFATLECPSGWRVPKKGDLSDPFYYGEINLIAIASEIYNKLILNRVVPHLELILWRNQNGFRRGRSTVFQILALRRIIEEMPKANGGMTLIFVDFKTTFDSVDGQDLYGILQDRPVARIFFCVGMGEGGGCVPQESWPNILIFEWYTMQVPKTHRAEWRTYRVIEIGGTSFNATGKTFERRRCEPLGVCGGMPPRKFSNLKAWKCHCQRSQTENCVKKVPKIDRYFLLNLTKQSVVIRCDIFS